MSQAPPAPFVVGVNRSGTTLLRLMLDAHPELAIPAETHFLPRLIARWRRLEERGVPEPDRRGALVRLITRHPRWPDLELGAAELSEHLAALAPIGLADVARALYVVHARSRGKERWGDKTPAYLEHMGTIACTLEEARFVHLIRDGRDVAVSLAEVSWGTNDAAEAARTWAGQIRAGRLAAAQLDLGRYMEVRYEELVGEPHRVLREIAELIELPWNDSMLRYYEGAYERLRPLERDRRGRDGRLAVSAAARRAQHATAAGPPRLDRVGRWRTEMAPEDRQRFEAEAGDLLDELGYS